MFKPKPRVLAFLYCTLVRFRTRVFSLPATISGFDRAPRRVLAAFFLLASPLFFLTRAYTPAYAAPQDTLNFQARLQTAPGSIAPDGYYNVEFKLYDAASGGTLLWTETYYDSNGVTAGNDNRLRVANGYLTVNLGELTSFPGTMPWDQQLYLTMNVGGTTQTATPTWDGEMDPRLKLTAVPYAYNAKTASQLQTSSGALTSTLSLQAPTVGSQTFVIQDQGAAGTYNILTEDEIDAGYIQNQNGSQQTANQWISGTARIDTSVTTPLIDTATAVALNIGTTNATVINLNEDVTIAAGKDITFAAGAGNFDQSSSTGTFSTGTGNVSLNGNVTLASSVTLTVQGSTTFTNAANVAFNKGTDFSTTGASDDVDFGTGVLFRLTGASTQTINGIANGADGRMITLLNAGSGPAVLANNAGTSAAANRITTGTGADLNIPVGGSIQLTYDSTASLWRVIGVTDSGANYVQLQGSTPGTAQTGHFNITGTGIAATLEGTTSVLTPSLDTASAVALTIGSTNATSITIGQAGVTTTVAGNIGVTLNGTTGTTSVCLNGSGLLSSCDASYLAPTASNFIQNQNSSAQTGNYWIDGTARADTSVLTPLLDTATAVALNIGTTNATAINLNEDVTIAAGKDITFAAGAGNFDQSSSTGTFSTGTGAVTLNGNTTVASGSNLTVTNGTTSLTGTTNINTSGTATTTIGNASATNTIAGTTGVTGNTSINTTGTGTTTIGSATGGAVAITANAASSFATNTGALTLTSAAAATWGTNAGLLTLQGAGGTTVTSSAGTTSSNVTIATGNASAGASGNIILDTGTATTTAGAVSIGTTNASGVTIGRAATTTTIQGNTAVTLSATTGTTQVCRNGSGLLSSCDASYLAPTASNFIQNQNSSAQTGNYWIDGTARADTSVLTPLLDTATAVALNIGTTNATVINLNENTTIASGKTLSITGDTYANISAYGSPTEGMTTYDTTNKQLLVYSNGKWKADSTDAILVAANNSSQADKNAAHYVADGTSDQSEINSALTAAAGKKVVLLAGTYIADGTILVPNNTTLSGVGNGTVVRLSVGTGSDNLIENTDTTTGVDVTIRDLKLDGSLGTGGNQKGVYLSGVQSGATVISVTSYDFTDTSIYINDSDDASVTNSFAELSANGVVVENSRGVLVSNNRIVDNTTGIRAFSNVLLSTFTGNHITGGTTSIYMNNNTYHNAISANTIASSTWGISLNSVDRNAISGNVIYNTSTNGIVLYSGSDYNTVDGNNIYNSGGGSNNNAILIESNSDGNSITSNTITDSSATTTNYAIHINVNTVDNTYLADNTLGGGSVNNLGTGTIFGGQSNGTSYLLQPAQNLIISSSGSTATIQGNLVVASTGYFATQKGADYSTTGTSNNVNFGAGTLFRLTGASAQTITGIAGGVDGRIVTLINAGSATAIIANLSGSSSAANQISTGTGADISVQVGSAISMVYDSTASLWRVIGDAAGGGGGGATIALDNLSGVAINTSLISDTTNTDDLGSSGITWRSGYFGTAVYGPEFDTVSAGALSIGSTNATVINLNQDVSIAAGKDITFAAGAGNFDQSNSTGTFSTGTGTVSLNGDTTIASGKTLSITGDTYANISAYGSPTEGMTTYDTTNKQLLVYSNGKWKADSTDAILVAASNSSQTDKNAADYVADGTSDQTEINSALTAAAGKKVVLLAGTYTADGTILVPNNTTLSGVGVGTLIQLDVGTGTDNLIENTDTSTGTNVTIRNLQIDGSLGTGGTQRGIYFNGLGSGQGSGSIHGADIINVTAIDFTENAIVLNDSDNSLVTSSVVEDSVRGIVVENSRGVVISNNQVINNSTAGIRLLSNSFLVNIANNYVEGNSTGISLTASYRNVISNNNLDANSYGITLDSADRNEVIGNGIHGTSNYGIQMIFGADANSIQNNNLYNGGGNDNNAIWVDNSDSNSITGNTISDSTTTSTNYPININTATADGTYLANNMFSSTTGDGTIRDLGTGTIYATQPRAENGMDVLNQVNISTSAYKIQDANGVSFLNVDSTNGVLSLGPDTIELGTATSATVIQGAGQTTSNTDGTTLTVQGSAGNGTGNGGALVLSGGTAGGGGSSVIGLVNLNPTAFSAISAQSLGTTQTLTQSWVDSYSTIPLVATTTGLTFTVPAPTISQIGRVLYISNAGSTNDFELLLNGTSITLALKTNSTATLIWNGNGWTAAGASSSTDLQSAYNNTLTSAGGAELILNPAGGNADGFTIRNNATTPINGGILEVQSSIGTNLLSVNNLGTELAANGGAETSATFSTDWTAAPVSATIARTTTSGEYVTGQAGVEVTTSTTQYSGVRNHLSGNPAVSTTYTVSFTAKSSINATPVDVLYSRDGGTSTVACGTYGTGVSYATLSDTLWTKVTCVITTDATTATNPDLIIRKTDTSAPVIYIDNLSFVRNDNTTQPSNVQIGGGITGGQVTLFTLDRSSTPPVANGDTTYLGSMYYDTTTGRIQCYEADGWGACGSAPDNIVILTPEYTNAVLAAPGILGGSSTATGVGTLTADFCSNQSGVLEVNTSFCASGLTRNYYRWTSPQATSQTYSIYVSYTLPSTFKNFYDSDTIKLTGLKDSNGNSNAQLAVLKSTGSAVTQCGSTTTITTSANVWHTTALTGDETACGFSGGDTIIFKINVSARSNSNVYIENLQFRYTNQ